MVTAAQAGDQKALDDLLRRHYDRMYAICRRIAGNDADAQDATQEAMMTVVRGLHRFDGRAAFSTWVYRVTTNACLDELRRRGRRPVPGLPEDQADGRPTPADDPPLDQSVADRLLLDAALLELPEEYRAAVVLRDQLGLDYAEIAEVLEIAPGTVRSRIARGRARLARELGGNRKGMSGRPSIQEP